MVRNQSCETPTLTAAFINSYIYNPSEYNESQREPHMHS